MWDEVSTKLGISLRSSVFVHIPGILLFYYFFCGSVPPNIYKKAKQAPEEKREATLIEELEQILAKEGLSSDPSEKGSVPPRIDFFAWR